MKSLIPPLTMILLFSSLLAQVASTAPSGSGTSGDPYLISSLANLSWLTQNSSAWSKVYKQTADIDASGTQYWDDADDDSDGDKYNDTNDGTSSGNNEGFLPIGRSSPYFTGSYDGQGYTITGLKINRSSTNYVGLFGYVSGGQLTNIALENVNITGYQDVGALVGRTASSTTITKSYSSGTIATPYRDAGGLVGYGNSVTITLSYSNASVSNTDGAADFIGGLVGQFYSGSLENSYATGNVDAGSGGFIGGLVGKYWGGVTVSKCYSKGSVSSSGSYIGGLIGYGVGTTSNSFWDTETSGQSSSDAGGTGKTSAQMKTQSTFTDAGWDFSGETTNGTNDYWTINGSLNGGYPHLVWAESVDSSLPVELASFTARVERSGVVVLEWVTESEIENLGFILERRTEGATEGWEEIANYITDPALQGQGSVTYRSEYSYTDNTVETGQTYDYRLADVSYAGVKEYHSLSVLSITVREVIPEKFALYQAYPNPFNPATTITFDLPSAQRVTIAIYDLNGREVATLTNREYSAGLHLVKWNASHFGSGVYFYRLNTGTFAATGKLLLVK